VQWKIGRRWSFTLEGKPIAQIAPLPPERRQTSFDGLRDRIELLPGWNDPVNPDRFLIGEL
jgi:hypothetical protein